MAVSFSTLLYSHCFDMFARSVTVTPLKSNPGAPAYFMRGIFNSGPITSLNDEGMVISEISDQETILDVRTVELTNGGHEIPKQGDVIYIDGDSDIEGGYFEIIDSSNNSGGQTTFSVRKFEPAEPMP